MHTIVYEKNKKFRDVDINTSLQMLLLDVPYLPPLMQR